jgi:toxin ParE1/3/4
MSAKRWRVHPKAREELDAKAARYERERAGLGDDFAAEYEAVYRRIAQSPQMGTAERIGGEIIRRALFDRFPYAVVFAETDDEYVIVAVAHVRRHPTYWERCLAGSAPRKRR